MILKVCLCLASLGVVLRAASAQERWPYYEPGVGTQGETKYLDHHAPRPSVLGSSKGESVIICSDLGRYVMCVGPDNATSWIYNSAPEWGPQHIARVGSDIVAPIGDEIVLISFKTGQRTTGFKPRPGRRINFAVPVVGAYLIGFESEKDPAGRQLQGGQVILWNEEEGETWGLQAATVSPRSGLLHGDLVIIAETFAQKVFAVSRSTGKVRWTIESIYPSQLQLLKSGKLLIVEEHANRIVQLDLKSLNKEVLFSANHPLFRDTNLTWSQLKRGENETIDPLSSVKGLSLAAMESSGRYTLYSPNGVHVFRDSLYIADTDNHRVVQLSDRKIITRELTSVFNPTGVLVMPP